MPVRRREASVPLPPEVQVVRSKGKTYYYWAPHRGTKKAGPRTPLPQDPSSPAFWAAIKQHGGSNPSVPAGSIAGIIVSFRASEDFTGKTESTRASYEVHMRRFEDRDAWGLLPAKGLTPLAVQTARDAMKDKPSMANQMLAVGRTVWNWAIPLGLLGAIHLNPFEKVKDLPLPDRGHVPWPEWAVEFVRSHGPQDIVRFVDLGIMTGQRESDLVRFGPLNRENNGLWCRAQKTRKKRRAFFIPLAITEAMELDRWAKTPMTFTNSRWLTPIARYRDDVYLYTPLGKDYTPDRIRARWTRWLQSHHGVLLCGRWRAWLAEQVKRYGWEIEAEEARGPTLHGLRGTAVVIRRHKGYEAQAIANDIGMSVQMVMHYTRFMDQMGAAEANRRRFEVLENTA